MPPSKRPLTRPLQPMPQPVAEALRDRGLEAAYAARPPYQQNDYLGWINRAVREATKEKRIRRMLAELEAGHGYMGMDWHPKT